MPGTRPPTPEAQQILERLAALAQAGFDNLTIKALLERDTSEWVPGKDDATLSACTGLVEVSAAGYSRASLANPATSLVSLTIQPGPETACDAEIWEQYPGLSVGGSGGFIQIGHRNLEPGWAVRALIRFPLDDVPEDVPISAAIHLSLFPVYSWQHGGDLCIYRLLRNWAAGAASFEEDGASWDEAEPGVPWQEPGAFGAEDCDQTELASVVVPDLWPGGEFVFPLAVSQKSDLGQYGFLLKFRDERAGSEIYFWSSYDEMAALRPKLVVTMASGGPTFRRNLVRRSGSRGVSA